MDLFWGVYPKTPKIAPVNVPKATVSLIACICLHLWYRGGDYASLKEPLGLVRPGKTRWNSKPAGWERALGVQNTGAVVGRSCPVGPAHTATIAKASKDREKKRMQVEEAYEALVAKRKKCGKK